ncbi:TRAP transporter small permease [Roseibium marinum]|uniref:TRAP transporter small permease protein n=1 Tax=Roseibium marinum TaxID=281252 RepID=A0A2S3V0U0_9HYPH|nr:TRAP transporter small permease [Roseibium marinum]POF33591.1 TRAP-type C4-dicarboxylate transport system permease small subunit [Roseibium marinum]
MHFFTRVASWSFGLLLLAFSLFVTLETLSRKIFNHSFQGADELGGYILAICGSLAFSVAVVERGHIRIDFLYDRMPPRVQAALNILATLSLFAFGIFFLRYCFSVIKDTLDYGSTAATPWATPLIYPQAIWYAALAIFFIVTALRTASAFRQLISGDLDGLNHDFGPKGVSEELNDELTDLRSR